MRLTTALGWVTVLVFSGVTSACGGSVAVRASGEPDGGNGQDTGIGSDSGRQDSAPADSEPPPDVQVDGADASPRDSGVPLYHRPDDSQCSQPAAPGQCQIMGGFPQCTMDSQCTAGNSGRCVENMGGALTCMCTYDTCVHDTDCPAGNLCVCHGSAYTGGDGNACMAGNCRVDSDCGAGGYCSPTHGTSGCGGVTGYYCHTPQDTCTNDTDCNGAQGPNVCAWSSASGLWMCQQQLLCG
jgi:hypothetical protein